MSTENEVMTVREAANFLRVSESRIRAYIWEKKLPVFQLVPGGAIRIYRQVLIDFMYRLQGENN